MNILNYFKVQNYADQSQRQGKKVKNNTKYAIYFSQQREIWIWIRMYEILDVPKAGEMGEKKSCELIDSLKVATEICLLS